MSMSDAVRVVSMNGSYTIDRAAELAKELGDAFAVSRNVVVDMGGLTDLDLAALQLLYAARRSAVARGSDFNLSGVVSQGVSRRLEAAGFIRQPVATGQELTAELVGFAPHEAG